MSCLSFGSVEIASVSSVRRRIALVLGTVSVMLLGFGTMSTSTETAAAAAPVSRAGASGTGTGGRTASVSVGEQLGNEVVMVSWTGFRPTLPNGLYRVLIVQCKANPVTMADCYNATPYPDIANGTIVNTVTGSDGTGSARFEIRPASRLPLLNCSATNACSIMVYENDGQAIAAGGLPAANAVIPITFAPSQADCPRVTDFDVRVDGSSSASSLFYAWAARLCTGAGAVVLDYTENSSTTGRENFLSGLTDMGITALPASDEELAAHSGHRQFDYVPLDATAMVVAYNFTDPFTGQLLDNIVLSPRLVARIITDTSLETFFQDRELLRLNPGVRFPTGTLSRPLLRAERNAGASILTQWFSSDADAQSFLASTDPYRVPVNSDYLGYTYPQDRFETVSPDPAYLPRQGQSTVALRTFYGVTPTGTAREDTSVNGVLGIVDLPTARRFGLKIALIAMPDGTSVGPTDDAVARGVADMDATPSGVLVNDPTPEDFSAYPMVRIDYAMVPKTFDSQSKVDKVKRVLNYALTEGQAQLPDGYFALPESMRVAALSTVSSVSIPVTTTATPTTVRRTYSGGGSVTTMAPETTTTTIAPTTTSTTSTSTTTTVAPVTVPAADDGLASGGRAPDSRVLLGLSGLSLAALLGSIDPKKSVRRKKS